MHFLGELCFVSEQFSCNDVKYALDPKTVEHLTRPSCLDRTRKISNLMKTNKISISNNKRKRRYINPNNTCKLCLQEIPRSQRHHLYQHCDAVTATPPVGGKHIDLRAAAKRCLAIVQQNRQLDVTPTNTKKRTWGDRDGESLGEVTPRRKRLKPTILRKTTTNRRERARPRLRLRGHLAEEP